MATKKEVLEAALRGEGCLGKAHDDEPVFILRAQDLFSDGLVQEWANRAAGRKCSTDKVADARQVAYDMQAWSTRKYPD